eukprot:1192557-Prorocentrum_minimum.AAC.1
MARALRELRRQASMRGGAIMRGVVYHRTVPALYRRIVSRKGRAVVMASRPDFGASSREAESGQRTGRNRDTASTHTHSGMWDVAYFCLLLFETTPSIMLRSKISSMAAFSSMLDSV